MTRIDIAVLCAALSGCGDASSKENETPAEPAEPPVACNPSGLTTAERAESKLLLEQLGGAIAQLDELPTGFSFRLDEARLPFASLSRWVDLERRCCPFFHFEIAVLPDNGGTFLRLTGGAAVKEMIRAELGSL
jgi:hypothetical protein